MIKHFFARLKGRNQVPPVKTDACGKVKFMFNEDFTKLYYKLTVKHIQEMTAAHIHLGKEGQNGPVVAFLFGPVNPGISVDKAVVKGVLTKDNLVGPLQGMTLADLMKEMQEGNAYVNVHTEQHPQGENRGQAQEIR
ncbi:CHRD domain-containing protein [Bacillus sp. CGMCC 1.60114]|uniref:CHRD domain-containing protein n=1 Tax=unclassified Bacillus (in: firmicutes) TaxID=185979 RepID=UPI00363AD69B